MQDGRGDGSGGGGRIIVESGDVVIVRLFVVVVVPLVPMADVGKSGRLVFGCPRAQVQDPDMLIPPSHLLLDGVTVFKHVIVVLVVFVFVVQA